MRNEQYNSFTEGKESYSSFLVPDFVDIQRKSFFRLLEKGILEEFSKINPIVSDVSRLNLTFYPERFLLILPNFSVSEAILQGKTYSCKLYVPATLSGQKTKFSALARGGSRSFGSIGKRVLEASEMVRRQPLGPLGVGAPLRPKVTLSNTAPLSWVLLGNLPLMTKRGHFVINGSPRVLVNQLTRCPGIYFHERKWGIGKTARRIVYADFVSRRGAWLRLQADKAGEVWARLKRTPKIPFFLFYESMVASERPSSQWTFSDQAALIEMYEEVNPTKRESSAQGGKAFLNQKFRNPRTYDLGSTGRDQLNMRFGGSLISRQLTSKDLYYAFEQIKALHNHRIFADDIDNLSNRRVRAAGDLVQGQFETGLYRLEKAVVAKMRKSLADVSCKTLVTTKSLNGALREFFGSSPLSQYMDQTNPLAEITQKRRISSLGPGGISRETAGMAIRGIHPTHYGRVCPIETPEGKNAGLVNSLTVFTQIRKDGTLESPYYPILQGQVQNEFGFKFLAVETEEQGFTKIAPGDINTTSSRFLPSNSIPIREAGNPQEDFRYACRETVNYIAVSPIQMISIATSLIPFLEHDDANRALMGSNMQRQAVPLLRAERPVVGTGLEALVIAASGHALGSHASGYISFVSNKKVVIYSKPKGTEMSFTKGKEVSSVFQKKIVAVNESISTSLAQSSVQDNSQSVGEDYIIKQKANNFGEARSLKKLGLHSLKPKVTSTSFRSDFCFTLREKKVAFANRDQLVTFHLQREGWEGPLPQWANKFTRKSLSEQSLNLVSQLRHHPITHGIKNWLSYRSPSDCLQGPQLKEPEKIWATTAANKIPNSRVSETNNLKICKRTSNFSLHQLFSTNQRLGFFEGLGYATMPQRAQGAPLRLERVTYPLQNYCRSNQETCLNHVPAVSEGEWVQEGDLIADCSASQFGELALGKNVLIAYLPWEGYNFEDAVVISERLVLEDVYTSIHIQKYEVETKETKFGFEHITPDVPGLLEEQRGRLDEHGIAKIGSWVQEGDILVGKVSPKGVQLLSPYERLAYDIANVEAAKMEDTSLRVPKGVEGRVINYHAYQEGSSFMHVFEPSSSDRGTEDGKQILIGELNHVRIYLAEERRIQVGDKVAGRHGNKGIVSTILPRQDMPYLPDGQIVDVVLNPLGIPSRMNVGQVFECLLGLAGMQLGQHFQVTPFDEIYGAEASRSLVYLKLYQARLRTNQNWIFDFKFPGKVALFDGRSGHLFDQWVTVGYAYMLKLVHLVDEKIHARFTGPYSLVTKQPLGGRSKHGGQRLGEMEVWALEGFGAAYILQEMLTSKSDDVVGRKQAVEAILFKGKMSLGNPEAFKVLVRELQALCLDVGVYAISSLRLHREAIDVGSIL